MKKTISILLALVLVLALSATAFAANSIEPNVSGTGKATTGDVTASYTDGTTGEVAKAYYVTVSWDVDSSLAYTAGNTTLTWNAEEMKYEGTTGDGMWSGAATVKVTVTNKSNAAITATAVWNKDTSAGASAEMKFDNATVRVESAADGVAVVAGQSGAEKTGTITGTISSGDVSGTISETDAKLGNVTVSFQPAD